MSNQLTKVDIHSTLSQKYDLDRNSQVGTWKPRSHNATYLLPFFTHSSANLTPETPTQEEFTYKDHEFENSETKFQFSLKSKMVEDILSTEADLWFGYTQQSHWQLFNSENSRPFRSTDYMPEVFVTQPLTMNLPLDGKLRMVGSGFMHHSNGEVDPLSRSWNRVYAMAGAEWGNLTVVPRVWARVKPDEKIEAEDNPNITDFYGYGDLQMYYDLDSGPSIASTLRYNPFSNRGSAQVDYILPLENNINLYVNFFHGYGSSIIDYNHKDTTFGIGVMLRDWKGQ